MSTKRPDNPFSVSAYLGPDYFCDREKEKQQLIQNLQNGSSTTLVSIRRIGKTSLLHHVLCQLPTGWKGIYVDLLETENMNQFLNALTSAIIRSVPEKTNLGRVFWNFIKSMRPVISFDSLTGAPQAGFEIKPAEVENNITALFGFLEKQESKFVIAIDEFQQILNYPESNTEAWLRTRIQQLKNVFFIFSGSRQHVINEMFSLPSRPFFRSSLFMELGKIESDLYCDFIVNQFNAYKKEISPAIASEILEWTNGHTFYVQQVCSRVFSSAKQVVSSDQWKQQAHLLLKEQETLFFTFRNMLTNAQWQLLKAIACEGKVYQPTAKGFLEKFRLGTSATVLRSIKTLQDYELVCNLNDANGMAYFSVNDVFFQRWSESR